ncbi:FYVE, RhoGEF and PH domain-containing protein 4 isoform X1 [Nothobranchius furzeri]|uniref:FYVE, RhoGEF and PH domain containing 4b n=3 Tax=Nothobranchius TaxID=28779 RepID=A0A8C6KPN6_NOTFU|nr:transcript variant X1 [Nothobranchius furzeri]
MFDLKKRNRLTLRSSSREAEEFRRVAVRRKDKGAVGDSHASEVSSGVWGSFNSGLDCDGTNPNSKEETGDKSPARSSLNQAHLQSPQGAEQDPPQLTGKIQDHSPNRKFGVSISCMNLSLGYQGSPSPIRVLGSPSPSKLSIKNCSPQREKDHSPAKTSPRSHSSLTGKLRTPSPVLKRMGTYIPARISKSWTGLHKISNEKNEQPKKIAEKSFSVPSVIVCMDEDRHLIEKVDCSLLLSANCNGSATAIKTPVKCQLCIIPGGHHLTNGSEPVSGQLNGMEQGNERPAINYMEADTTPRRSRFSCEWTKGSTADEKTKMPLGVETNGEEKMSDEKQNHPKDEEVTERKLYNIANELLQTERAYVARLHLLDQVFCLRLAHEADRGSFPPEVIKNIFSNISSIYSFHSQFLLPDLEQCICSWGLGPGLGRALLLHGPFLRMYADYVRNFDQAMELLRTWTERSSAFRNIIQDIQSQDVCGNLTLQHHMLEPVQRVPRYEMLLKDYLKKLPEDNPDYEPAQKSLEAVSMAATHSNSAIHKAESLKRLLEIYEMVGEEEVVNPTNEFLKEGRLLKLAARNASAMERHLFLFNNFLLCCSAKFSLVGQKFTVRCRIGVDGMKVHQTTNEDHLYTFQVSGKEKSLELQASSEQDRDEWIEVIQEAINVFQKKNETFKMVSKELYMEEPAKELGRRAPRWIRDNEVNVCMICREPFNALTRRRHHCRACGYVVCWRCSDNKASLEYDGNKLNKVCKACYSILTGQRGERMDRKKRRMIESDTHAGPQDIIMSSYLQYGDNSMIWQQVWCILPGTDPPVLQLYTTPQDEKPLVSVPLLGCVIEDLLQGQHCFCLKESRTCHILSCEDSDLKQSWLTVLKLSVMRNL